MNYPEFVWKELAFGDTPNKQDLQTIKRIQPQGGEALLHIVFSDERFPNIQVHGAAQRYISISMLDHLNNNDIRVEDSFPVATFVFDVRVLSDVGRCRGSFVLYVGNRSFRDLRMRKLNLFERLTLRIKFPEA